MNIFMQNGLLWAYHDGARPALGILPEFLSDADPRPAREQLDENYAHGGGWRKFEGFTLVGEPGEARLEYPGDPPMQELARTILGNEQIVVFQYSWVAIVQPDGSYEIASMY